MNRSSRSTWLAGLAAGILWPVAAWPADTPNGSAAPVAVVDQVVVPVPREVFVALDALGPVNWAAMVRVSDYAVQADRAGTALVLGVVIADGFIAVQAEDREATKKLGPKVLELAELLGVKEAVASHAKAIVEAADTQNWAAVRTELDRTQETVKETMKSLRDEHLAHFVSIGGWLRGTEAAAGAILTGYTADKAELMHQPGLVAHFRGVVGRLDAATRAKGVFRDMAGGLPEIEKLMEHAPLSEAGVRTLQTRCGSLVVAILGGAAKEGGPP